MRRLTLYALLTLGLPRRGARLARMAAARRRRPPLGDADHVRPRRRAAADRVRAAWLPGYEDSRPVRIGNAAHAAAAARCLWRADGRAATGAASAIGCEQPLAWELQHVAARISGADLAASRTTASGRCAASRAHFTYSKMMAWVAFDRAIKSVRAVRPGRPGASIGGSCATRSMPRSARNGFDRERNTFVQYYGARDLDASLLLIPLVGFLPPDDPRVRGTVAAIERELMRDGFVCRYPTAGDVDGLPRRRGRVSRLQLLARRQSMR